MTQDCDCEYLLLEARDYLALLLSHDAVSAELNQDLWPSWQVGYFVASVGRSSRAKVEKYLDNQ